MKIATLMQIKIQIQTWNHEKILFKLNFKTGNHKTKKNRNYYIYSN